MTLLLRSDSRRPERDVLVFGSGAVGGAVVSRLQRRHSFSPQCLDVPWARPSAREQSLDAMCAQLERGVRERPLSVVWAAGKAGLGATDDETAGELAGYRNVVELVQRVRQARGGAGTTFHMTSSAGGLFEGRAVRSASEPPSPLRAYGRLKLAQEELGFDQLNEGMAVYRPSSIYTVPGRGGRLGLIGALVSNGLAQRESTIVGALDTLRDYVMGHDVGAYIADRALEDVDVHHGVHMLVSGHPASILQVITAVESVLRRRLYVRIAESWNARNITFLPAVKPARFVTTPLRVGVQMVHAASLGRSIGG